jgi:hypothetical protein
MSLPFQHDVEERLRKARADGCITIVAHLADGPDAGNDVACITKRKTMRERVQYWERHVSRLPRRTIVLDSVRAAIAKQVAAGVSWLNPATDTKFMDDLAILMAAKLVLGSDVVEGAGLSNIMIAVEEDHTLPWTAELNRSR